MTEPLSNKIPYVEAYDKRIIPSASGSLVGEISNRTYQYLMPLKTKEKNNEN